MGTLATALAEDSARNVPLIPAVLTALLDDTTLTAILTVLRDV